MNKARPNTVIGTRGENNETGFVRGNPFRVVPHKPGQTRSAAARAIDKAEAKRKAKAAKRAAQL